MKLNDKFTIFGDHVEKSMNKHQNLTAQKNHKRNTILRRTKSTNFTSSCTIYNLYANFKCCLIRERSFA